MPTIPTETEPKHAVTAPATEGSARPGGPEKRRLRALEYRRLAAAAEAMAEASPLANIREKHERACATWTALALLDEGSADAKAPPA
jgi:hypothetical protein